MVEYPNCAGGIIMNIIHYGPESTRIKQVLIACCFLGWEPGARYTKPGMLKAFQGMYRIAI